ncbi:MULTISPECIES: hypothetical protein [Xenorhabdus]|uniref:hypothetical protein n=1 Tax=Xenorhabdus TaxID=626 RepID=UPI0006AA55DD|nr:MULTISPECIES: hypothetical protein [Xenorhabdus]KOP33142.1 hypothetical protein AFK69_11235 [Xenorhabdus sp. GDc328]
MKKNILFAMIFIPSVVSASKENQEALDYCSTVESWPAQRVIMYEFDKDKQLDGMKATSVLINRTKLTKGKKQLNFKIGGSYIHRQPKC